MRESVWCERREDVEVEKEGRGQTVPVKYQIGHLNPKGGQFQSLTLISACKCNEDLSRIWPKKKNCGEDL